MDRETVANELTYTQALDIVSMMFPKAVKFVQEVEERVERCLIKDWLFENRCVFMSFHHIDDHNQVRLMSGVENFIYHRRTGIVFNTIRWANHTRFMSGLLTLEYLERGHQPRKSNYDELCIKYWMCNPNDMEENVGDEYLFYGLGFYQSSTSHSEFYIHKNFKMNRKESQTFEYLKKNVFDFSVTHQVEAKVEEKEAEMA